MQRHKLGWTKDLMEAMLTLKFCIKMPGNTILLTGYSKFKDTGSISITIHLLKRLSTLQLRQLIGKKKWTLNMNLT